MRNVFKLFSYDIKHLFGNAVTLVIVLGLVFLPSIFTWYNVIACWNVFDNTGNLKVAVANSDEGYQSDLPPTKINVGDSVESALRANDQLDWVFTNEEDAIDGARSGKYYAAVVIPQSFSSDMMSFYSDDAEHPELIYYENEKKNAVAPRVTDQASNKVAAQVNTTFAETISDVALGLIDTLGTVADDTDAAGRVAKLSGTISSSADQMRTAADVLDSYANLAGTAQALVGSSTQLLGDAQSAVKDAKQQASGAKSGADTIGDALSTSVSSLSDALAQCSDGFNQVPAAIDEVYAQVDTDKAHAAQGLRDQAADVDAQIERYQQLVEVLESLKPQVDEQYRPAVDAVISQLNTSISSLEKLRDSLTSAADKIVSGNDPESASRADIQAKLDEAKANADKLKNDYENNLKPGLESLAGSVAQAAQSLSARASQLSGVGDDLNGAASSVTADLAHAQSAIRAMSDELRGSADKMSALSQRVNEALASGNIDQLKQIIGSDPEALAKAVSAPVGVERIAVFPVEDFGSAMAPLYTTLALWVGSLLIMVLLNPVPSERAKREADLVEPRSWQLFFGRYGGPFVLAFMQSTVVCLGNMLFVGVQVADPLLYLLCFWTAGFVFSFIIYTLVSLFANLGKALAVLLLIIYVTGGGGSFPLQLLPGFFQAANPFLPATHVINAMRAASMGVYQNDFWVQIGITLCFIVPFVIMGILRPVLSRFTYWFVEQVEKSKMVA